jgi:hypothetical protein
MFPAIGVPPPPEDALAVSRPVEKSPPLRRRLINAECAQAAEAQSCPGGCPRSLSRRR